MDALWVVHRLSTSLNSALRCATLLLKEEASMLSWAAEAAMAPDRSGLKLVVAEARMKFRRFSIACGARHVGLGEIHPARIELATFSV